MDNVRVVFKGLDAKAAIEKYDGPLYNALFSRVLEFMCKWQTGNKEDFETVEEWLLMNNIAVIKDGKLYPKVPLLTVDIAKNIQKEIINSLNSDFSGYKEVKKIAEKCEEWDDIGHLFVSQIILGSLLFYAWLKSCEDPKEPVALIVSDLDHNPVFVPGITPLKGNEVIAFWQTNQLGHPNTIYDILKSNSVIKSLETIKEDYTFTGLDDSLALMSKLKMYKQKSVDGTPSPYISLPKLQFDQVKKYKQELTELVESFITNIEALEKIAKKFYDERPEILKMVEFCNYRNFVYYVFSYCVVDDYYDKDLLSNGRVAKDSKSKSSSPKWTMA